VLYDFASRYAKLQASQGDIKPTKEEIADMTKRAARVAQLLRDLKKIVNPNAASSGDEKGAVSATSDEYRAPKRPWEEISKDQPEASNTPTVSSALYSIVKLETLTCPPRFFFPVSMTRFLIADGIVANGTFRFVSSLLGPPFLFGFYSVQVTNPGHQRTASLSEKPGGHQTTAEKDMEIIRNKRASSTGGSVVGQQKSKYRKRSVSSLLPMLIDPPPYGYQLQRASPPGKCHSCNIRETPEWRRGPDGARTLCNACGLREFLISSLACRDTQMLPPPDRLCEAHEKEV